MKFNLISTVLVVFSFWESSAETLVVEAIKKWNAASTIYAAGKRISISTAEGAKWGDVNGTIEVSANGYPNAVGITLRYEAANIMEMICCMNSDIDLCTNIGKQGTLIAPVTGFVSCFANDSDKTYGNNVGSIEAEINA